jgi:ubiquinone/menaquinone biosynthesis C-methylase UbiE
MAALAVRSDQPDPQLIWDTINAYQRTAALRAAVELDVFSALGEGALGAETIAGRCHASPRGVRILCDYLTVAGLLFKQSGQYSLTPTSATFLDRGSPACLASTIHFLNSPKLMAGFSNLTETVRRGGTLLPREGVNEAEIEEWVLFAKSMTPLLRASAKFMGELAGAQDPRPRRVLDIAAGHGLFGIAIATTVREAEVIAQDWPNVLEVAKQNAAAAGVSDRYGLLPGDAFELDLGSGYDVVLLTNLLHHFDGESCLALLRKAHASLNSAGRLFTLEFVPNEDRVSPPIAASFSLMMLGLTPAGDAYTMSQLNEMLQMAGFRHNELFQVPDSPQQLVVSGK